MKWKDLYSLEYASYCHTYMHLHTHTQSFVLSKLVYMHTHKYTHKVQLLYLRIYNFLKLLSIGIHQAVCYFLVSIFCWSCSTERISFMCFNTSIHFHAAVKIWIIIALIMKAIYLAYKSVLFQMFYLNDSKWNSFKWNIYICNLFALCYQSFLFKPEPSESVYTSDTILKINI